MQLIKCRYCNRDIGAPGMGSHIRTHGVDWSDAEVARHGYRRDVGGHLIRLDAPPVATPIAAQPTIAARRSGPGGLVISEEAMRIALSGLHKIQAEINGYVDECESKLAGLDAQAKPPGNNRKVLQVIAERYAQDMKQGRWVDLAAGAEPITSSWKVIKGSAKRVWSNDPESLYRHHANGTIIYIDGEPSIKGPTSEAQKRSMAKARMVRYKERQRVAKSAPIKLKEQTKANGFPPVKMEYWPNGEPKYRTNPDGSVKLSQKGKPWKRIRQAVATASAIKAHVARGIKPPSALKKAQELIKHAGEIKPHKPIDPRASNREVIQ